MTGPHHHVIRTVLIALFTQGVGCAVSIWTTPRVAEAFAALGATAAVFVACGGSVFRVAGRRAVCGGFLTVWSLRLSIHLFMRNRPPKIPLSSLAISRTAWSAAAALPVVLLIATPSADDGFMAYEALAIAFAATSLALETVADIEKNWWHRAKEGPVVTEGVWSISRHANLAGEGMFHLALCATCVRGSSYAAVSCFVALAMLWHLALNDYGPLVCSERTRAVLYEHSVLYDEYVKSTSVYWPIPKIAWRAMGIRAKRLLFDREDWRRGAALSIIASVTSDAI